MKEQYLILMTGLPGTGKSTVARKLQKGLENIDLPGEEDWDLHSILQVRRDFGYKRYGPVQKKRDVTELLMRTNDSLWEGRNVIKDSTHVFKSSRQSAYDLASRFHCRVLVLETVCSEKEAKRRIKNRSKNNGIITEPRDPKVYDSSRRKWEETTELKLRIYQGVSHLRYDSEKGKVEEVRINPHIGGLVNGVEQILLS